jgi:hypothetical protein
VLPRLVSACNVFLFDGLNNENVLLRQKTGCGNSAEESKSIIWREVRGAGASRNIKKDAFLKPK